MRAEYNYRGKRERAGLYLSRGMRRTHIHNDHLWQQFQPQTILRHIYPSPVQRRSDSGSSWWMRHRRSSERYFSFPEQTIQTSEMNIAGRRNTSNKSSVGRQEEADDLYTRRKKKKTPVGIPHTLGVTGSVFWVHFAQDNGSFGRSFSVYSCQPVSHSVSHCRKHFQSYRLKLMCIKVWVLHNHTSWAWTGFCYLLGTDHVRTGSPWGPKWGPHHVWGPGWVQGHAMNQRWVKLKVWVRLSSYRSFVVSFVHHFMQFTLKSV